jgi:hypothetical protein
VLPSVEANSNVAFAESLGLGGPDVIAGDAGGTVSIVHEYDVEPPAFPSPSRARTANVCGPSARLL